MEKPDVYNLRIEKQHVIKRFRSRIARIKKSSVLGVIRRDLPLAIFESLGPHQGCFLVADRCYIVVRNGLGDILKTVYTMEMYRNMKSRLKKSGKREREGNSFRKRGVGPKARIAMSKQKKRDKAEWRRARHNYTRN